MVDADILDIENVTEALETSPYGRCVYEAGNDVVDHQVVLIEYEGGVTASMTMSACKFFLSAEEFLAGLILTLVSLVVTEDICDRGTKIHGTKGELIGDMRTFVRSIPLPSRPV